MLLSISYMDRHNGMHPVAMCAFTFDIQYVSVHLNVLKVLHICRELQGYITLIVLSTASPCL